MQIIQIQKTKTEKAKFRSGSLSGIEDDENCLLLMNQV